MNRFRLAAPAAVLALAATPAAATAHVTLQPEEAPAGGFARLDVRVPNERDDASTKKVQVQFPPGFIFVSTEPVAGWTAKVKMRKLDKPVEAFGEQHSEEVDTITFATKGKGIAPGQFRDFGLSLGLPDKPESTLTFKALQTYSSGEVVRWIGAPDSEEPAPQVRLAAGAEQGAAAHGDREAGAQPAAAPAESGGGGGDEGGGGSDTLAVIALIVGALGLIAGAAGLAAGRRTQARPAGA